MELGILIFVFLEIVLAFISSVEVACIVQVKGIECYEL